MLTRGMPPVSIVIPMFNDGEWVCGAVDSALAQTYPACEIIVVDDGSTDGSASMVIDKYGTAVTCVRRPHRGLAAARNAGLAAATGDYVQFLDADDILLPGKIATHVSVLQENPAYGVVYSDFAFVDEHSTASPTASGFGDRYRSGSVMDALLQDNFIVVHAALCRLVDVRAADGFDEQLSACEDYDLWLRLAASGCLFLHTPDVLVLYRRRAGSMSAASVRQIAATIDVLSKVPLYAALDPEGQRACRRRLTFLRELKSRTLVREAVALAKRGRLAQAARSFIRALSADPAAVPRTCARAVMRGNWRAARPHRQDVPR